MGRHRINPFMLLSFKETPGDKLEGNMISVVKQPHFVSFKSKTHF
jgi:hypothetical protein